jgi:predicted PurR-regulated permease PerM
VSVGRTSGESAGALNRRGELAARRADVSPQRLGDLTDAVRLGRNDTVSVAAVPEQQARRRVPPTAGTQSPVSIAPRTLVTFILLSAGALALGALVIAVHSVLIQLIVAIVLAMALEPLVEGFERRGVGRGASVGITFGLVAAALIGFAYFLFQPLVTELEGFANDLPRLLHDLTHGRGRLGFLEARYHIVERVRDAVKQHGVTGATGQTLGFVTNIVQTGGALVFIAFLTLFVQLGGRQWFDSLVGFVPGEHRDRVRRMGSGVSRAVGGYVAGNLLISVIAGTVTTLVLLATHVPYPVPLGLVVAVFDLVPLVGATVGTVIVGSVALTQGISTAAIVVAAMIVYQQIENHTIQQLVYHRTVQLSALAISVSVAAGAELGGVVGALLGIPAAGALKVVFGELAAWRHGEAEAT